MPIDDPVLWWGFDEAAGSALVDKSGEGNTGTLVAGARITGRAETVGALSFDGTSGQYAEIDTAPLALNLGTVYTIAMWVKVNEAGDGVIAAGSGTGTYAFYFDATDLYHSVSGNFGSKPHGGLSAWTHLAITRNAGSFQFYKNGAPLGAANSIGTTNEYNLLRLSGYEGGSFPAQIDLDEFRLYDRELSGAEVAELYAWTGWGTADPPLVEDAESAGTLDSGGWVTWAGGLPLRKVSGNIVGVNPVSGAYGGSRYATSLGPDLRLLVPLDISSGAFGGNYMGFAFCCTAQNADVCDCYILGFSGGNATLYRRTNGADTQIGNQWAYSWSAGDRIGIKKVGSKIEVYSGPNAGAMTLRISAVDATYSSGHIAIDIYDPSSDDIRLREVRASGAEEPPPPDPQVRGGAGWPFARNKRWLKRYVSGIRRAYELPIFDETGAPGAVTASGIPSAESWGSPSLTRAAVSVGPTGIASGETWGSITVSRGAAAVSPGGIPSAEAFGSPTLSRGAVSVSPGGIPSAESFGSPEVARAAVGLSGAGGIASGEAWGSLAVTRGAAAVSPGGIPSAEAWGGATVTRGPVSVSVSGIPSGEVWGSPLVGSFATLSPAGIGSAEAFGGPAVTRAPVSVSVAGIPSAESWGSPTLTRGSAAVSVAGIPSAESWGTPLVQAVSTVVPAGIPSAEAFGTPAAVRGPASVSPAGIPSAESFGGVSLTRGGVSVSVVGIPSAESFGSPLVRPTQLVAVTGIPSAESWGAVSLARGEVDVATDGIPSAESFGAPAVLRGAALITLGGIPSEEAFGTVILGEGPREYALRPGGYLSPPDSGRLEGSDAGMVRR